MYRETHCNIGSKRAFPTGLLDRWHNCLLIYWRYVAQLPRPNWFVSISVITQQDVHGDRQRLPKNLGRYLSCMQCTAHRKNFELVLMEKMKTRHPVEGQFGREFPAICNHCKVMTAWSCTTWKFCEQFFRFSWKNDPSQTVTTARIAPKICQGLPPTFGSHLSRFHPNWFTFGKVMLNEQRPFLPCGVFTI